MYFSENFAKEKYLESGDRPPESDYENPQWWRICVKGYYCTAIINIIVIITLLTAV